MRHTNHQRASFLLTQESYDGPRRCHGIEILQGFEIIIRDQAGGANSQTKQSDAHAANFLHYMNLDSLFQRATTNIIIA